jgi:hypothetical protein
MKKCSGWSPKTKNKITGNPYASMNIAANEFASEPVRAGDVLLAIA